MIGCPHCKVVYCSKCGKQVDRTWVYCPWCGHKFKELPS